MATTAAAKTPRIQLVLNLQAEHAATERVKRVTNGAGGGEPASAPCDHHRNKTPANSGPTPLLCCGTKQGTRWWR